MSSDEANPWTSDDESKEGVWMVKVFFIHDEEDLAIENMRNSMGDLAAELKQTVENEGWIQMLSGQPLKILMSSLGGVTENFKGICYQD